jgi:predicted transcriptional regulator
MRRAGNMSYYDMALEIGISDRTIRHILQGDIKKWNDLTIYKLEKFFSPKQSI